MVIPPEKREVNLPDASIKPVHHPVLDGFGDMGRGDLVLSGQIRDRPADLQNPVISAGAKSQSRHGGFQELLGLGADLAEFLDLFRPHLGIGTEPLSLEPLELPRPGTADSFSDPLRALAFCPRYNIPELDLWHLDLDIDAVKKRAGDFGVISTSLRFRAVHLETGQAAEDILAGLCCQVAI